MKLYKVKNEKDGILVIRLENETINLKKGEEVEFYSDKKLLIEGIEELPFDGKIIKIKDYFYVVSKDGKGEPEKLTSLIKQPIKQKETKKVQPKPVNKIEETKEIEKPEENVETETKEITEEQKVETPKSKRRGRRKTTQK